MQIFSFTPHSLEPSFILCSWWIRPETLRDCNKDDFMSMEQGGMSMAAYEAKLHAFLDRIQNWLLLRKIGYTYFLRD